MTNCPFHPAEGPLAIALGQSLTDRGAYTGGPLATLAANPRNRAKPNFVTDYLSARVSLTRANSIMKPARPYRFRSLTRFPRGRGCGAGV